MNINSQISKQITFLIEEQNLNIDELSLESTLSTKEILGLLNCSKMPTIETLSKICAVFELNTCEFFDSIISEELKVACN